MLHSNRIRISTKDIHVLLKKPHLYTGNMSIILYPGFPFAYSFSFDPTVRHTFWGFMLGSCPIWAMVYGISQASVQRYSATKSLKHARL